uniref:uncharacterized protein LOC132660585 n=1 Tax=Panthera onca TaxID=9690 RepID=UPI002952BC85|nr:uncharacterized protein LOC132660585 [Panthera onca]
MPPCPSGGWSTYLRRPPGLSPRVLQAHSAVTIWPPAPDPERPSCSLSAKDSVSGAPPKRPPHADRPPPSPGPGGLAPDSRPTQAADGFHSPPLPAPQIYIWRSPPPARPEKLLESWKRFRRAPRLSQKKKKKNSQRPPPDRPGCRPSPCALSPGPWVLLPPNGGGGRWEPPAERPGTGPHDLRCAWTLRRLRTFPVLEATVPSLAVKCGAVIRCFLPICATDRAEKRTKSLPSRMYMMRRKHAGCDFFLPPYSLPVDKHRHRAPDPSGGLRPLYQLFRGSHWSLEKVQAPSLPSSPCIRSARLQRQVTPAAVMVVMPTSPTGLTSLSYHL